MQVRPDLPRRRPILMLPRLDQAVCCLILSCIAVLWRDSVSHNRDFPVVAVGVPPISLAKSSIVFCFIALILPRSMIAVLWLDSVCLFDGLDDLDDP